MWRVGNRVPINVYKDDQPVCMCQSPELAAEIVEACNLKSTRLYSAGIDWTPDAAQNSELASLRQQVLMLRAEREQFRELASKYVPGVPSLKDDTAQILDARLHVLTTERDQLRARFTAPIVCMCGSTRFKQAWITENARLTNDGQIVLSVGLWGHHERIEPTEEQKVALDVLHKRKIDLCDWIWVLDVGGYIGASTQSEIDYATNLNKPIRYLSREYPNYEEPVDQLRAQLQEAIEALRKINKWDQQEHTCGEDDGPCLPCKIGETARTVLAKHPEVKP